MRQYCMGCLVAMMTGLVGCADNDVRTSSTAQAVAGTNTLYAGERLYPGQEITSGSTVLVYQGDNNLVLYQNGTPIWATMAGLGYPTDRFEMQTDCNAVVYSGWGYVWASWTNGQGSNCFARVIEGDWFICSGTTRVFSARGGGDCSSGGGMPAGYVGCFTDDSNRALPAWQGTGFSLQACIDTCRNQNYAYAGAQWYDQCFCGNTLGYAQVSDAECNTPCNSGGGYCGGAWRNSIYATGASGGSPCGNGSCGAGEDCNNCPSDCGACPPAGSGAFLRQGESLYPGQCRTSPSGQYRLCLQADGNLVVQQNGGTIWAANTAGSAGWATLQANGSLVVYNSGGGVVWQTGDASPDLQGPPALAVLDEGDVVIDQETNIEGLLGPPPQSDGPCVLELHSRTAADSGIGIHDVVVLKRPGGVQTLSMQGGQCNTGQPTCNDTAIGDGCPIDPEKDAKDPEHDTQMTWSRQMSDAACAACAQAYQADIGYEYKLADSNGAVNDCITAAINAGANIKHPPLVSWLHFIVPSFRFGRNYNLPFSGQGGKTPQQRCSDAIAQYGCGGLAQSGCATVCGATTGTERLCSVCPSTPGCACVPTTSCAQQGANCGTIWNGCAEESCGQCNGQSCVNNVCQGCTPTTSCAAQGADCGQIFDGCAWVSCGQCSGQECINNVCQGCLPTTSCDAEGASCGEIFDGCQWVSCPDTCVPPWNCGTSNQCECVSTIIGDCDYAWDECANQYIYLGSCNYDEMCQDNWCVPIDYPI